MIKQFIYRTLLFFSITLLVIVSALFFIHDKSAQKNVLASIKTKHEKLQKTTQPKIIFAGGSNVSFGLDCKLVSDSLKMPALSTAMHGGLGLEFMANHIKPYIHKGDLVVLIPEYENFYTDNFYGEMELVSLLFDVDPQEQKNINSIQWMHLTKYIIPYAAKKIRNQFSGFFQKEKDDKEIDIYDKNSFNEYGDSYIHWNLPNQKFSPLKVSCEEKIKPEVISFIKTFNSYVESKQAKLVLLPPVLEEKSYNNLKTIITKIEISLIENNIPYYRPPARYKFATNYFFNTYYHLNRKGVDLRTQLIIEDLKSALNHP